MNKYQTNILEQTEEPKTVPLEEDNNIEDVTKTDIENSKTFPDEFSSLVSPKHKNVPWHHPTRNAYRFAIMLLSSIMCTGVYMGYDSIGALSPYLKGNLEIDSQEYGYLVAAYSLPNVILAALAGVIVDKFGYNKTSLIFSFFVILGNVVIALSNGFYMFVAGRFIFGLGGESLIVAQTSILSKWFTGKQLGLSFGFSLSFGMMGSMFAYWILPTVAEMIGFRLAFWFSVGMCVISFFFNVLCVWMDARAAHLLEDDGSYADQSQGKSLTSVAYWLCIVICLSFYGSMTWVSYANDLLYNKYGYDEITAAKFTSLMYVFSVVLSPVFGWLVDMYGKRLYLMTFGMFIMIPTFLLFALTDVYPIFLLMILGFAYALVPAVLWTLFPLIVDEKYIGKAYGISYALYDGTIFLCPIMFGGIYNKTGTQTAGLGVFAAMTAVGMIALAGLWILNKRTMDDALQKPSVGATQIDFKKLFTTVMNCLRRRKSSYS